MRLGRPVSGSWRASCAIRSTSRRWRVTTAAPAASRWAAPRTANQRHSPSAWRRRCSCSSAAVRPSKCAASAARSGAASAGCTRSSHSAGAPVGCDSSPNNSRQRGERCSRALRRSQSKSTSVAPCSASWWRSSLFCSASCSSSVSLSSRTSTVMRARVPSLRILGRQTKSQASARPSRKVQGSVRATGSPRESFLRHRSAIAGASSGSRIESSARPGRSAPQSRSAAAFALRTVRSGKSSSTARPLLSRMRESLKAALAAFLRRAALCSADSACPSCARRKRAVSAAKDSSNSALSASAARKAASTDFKRFHHCGDTSPAPACSSWRRRRGWSVCRSESTDRGGRSRLKVRASTNILNIRQGGRSH